MHESQHADAPGASGKGAATEVVVEQHESCGSCRYWLRLADQATEGRCRAHPPVWRVDAGRSEWPRTAADDWCGAWREPKEAAR